MQSFDADAATEYISHLIFQEQSDAVGMTGLLYLMETFDAIARKRNRMLEWLLQVQRWRLRALRSEASVADVQSTA